MNAEVEITTAATTFLTAVDNLEDALADAIAPREPNEDGVVEANKLERLLERVEQQARAHKPDVSTDAGRKAIRSNVYKIKRSRTAIDAARKNLGEDYRERLKKINEAGNGAVARLEDLEAECNAALAKWEEEEVARITAHDERMKELIPAPLAGASSEDIQAEIDRVKAIKVDAKVWEEFATTAADRKSTALATLKAELARAKEREEQQAELRALKEELATRRAEDERRAAEEAARARAEADRISAEKAAKERLEAEERAAQAAREQAEREAQEKIEEEKRRAAAAEEARQKAEADAAAAKAEAEQAAKEAAERAVKAEQERVAEQRRQEQMEATRRAQDEAHRAKVRREIEDAIETILGDSAMAKAVTRALWEGQIPFTRVEL